MQLPEVGSGDSSARQMHSGPVAKGAKRSLNVPADSSLGMQEELLLLKMSLLSCKALL